jgi:mono/diheme cytochrome c family protein
MLLGLRSAAQAPQQPPSVLIDSLAGRDSFELYCASCHGSGGRGDGPLTRELRTRPADLTALARRSNGTFPREGVRAFITGTGRTVAAHGTTEMPIWGPLFRAFESDARTRERISNLVSHIESIQAPAAGRDDRGAQLFRTHCSSCHGPSGSGNGPMAGQLRRTPPDLTQYAARNRGVFPRDQVHRIIEGRGVASHGNQEMPVWGDVFKNEGARSSDEVRERIDAIVRYLEGIQNRAARRPGRGDAIERASLE